MNRKPIKIIFARKKRGISKYIQSKTWSVWSHVAIIDGDSVIQSVGIPPLKLFLVLFGIIPNSVKLGGVVRTPMNEFLETYKDTRIAYIDGNIDIARAMIDVVMYDAWGIVGLRFGKRIDCADKMSCAKLVWVCHAGLRNSFANRATPQRILEASYDTKKNI